MKALKFTFLLAVLASFTFISCDDEPLTGTFTDEIGTGDENNSGTTSSMLEKWWYDSNNLAADIYFHSSGQYEQKVIVSGVEITATGDWYWEDENTDIIKVENIVGAGQTVSEVWFKILSIQANSLTLQQSTNSTDYSADVFYQDTDN